MPTPKSPSTDRRRQQTSSIGGLISWANTVDRAERTARGRKAGPGDIAYWTRLKRAESKFADATDDQVLAAALAAQKAHYKSLALKSVASRRIRREMRGAS